uniref:Vacuolar protein sorting-associated protein 35 n=1 Tax=Arcella intermedia TaxID=1963864 RepID=A0A6B2L057_9EUKA
MQHGVVNLDKREQERAELNVLVGKNLSRLGQLEGLTIDLYKTQALPTILSHILQCKDRIAQQNLTDIIIQAFSDEYHLRTLPMLLETCSALEEDVAIQTITSSLVDRISNYCSSNNYLPTEYDLFETLKAYLSEITEKRKLSLSAHLQIIYSLIVMTIKCYKNSGANFLSLLNTLYDMALQKIKKSFGLDSKSGIPDHLKILKVPLDLLKTYRPLMLIPKYLEVVHALPSEKMTFSNQFIDSLLQFNAKITNAEEFATVMQFIEPLTKKNELADEDWQRNQFRVASVLNLIYHNDIGFMYEMLLKAKEFFLDPSKSDLDVTHGVVPIVFKSLQLIQNCYKEKDSDPNWEKKVKAICKLANDLVTAIKETKSKHGIKISYLTFNLYLQCTLLTGKCGLANYAYQFFTQGAILVFEEEGYFAEINMDYTAIHQMITITSCIPCFDPESYEKLVKRLAQYSTKVQAPENQIRLSLSLAHLFKSGSEGDIKSALACLKRAMTSALAVPDAEVDLKAQVLVELVDHFLYFFKNHPDVCEAKYVNGAIERTTKFIGEAKLAGSHLAQGRLANIKSFIEIQQDLSKITKKKEKPQEVTPEGTEVENKTLQFEEAVAKKEVARWKTIEM